MNIENWCEKQLLNFDFSNKQIRALKHNSTMEEVYVNHVEEYIGGRHEYAHLRLKGSEATMYDQITMSHISLVDKITLFENFFGRNAFLFINLLNEAACDNAFELAEMFGNEIY